MEIRKKTPQTDHNVVEIELPVHLNDEGDLEGDLVALEECIEELKPDQKECVSSFFLQRNSYQKVAEQTGFEVKTVKSYIQNGKRNLKKCLEQKNVRR